MQPPAFTWADISTVQQRLVLGIIDGDGHTIWPATRLRDMGLDERIVVRFQRTYESDTSDPKTTIYDSSGAPIGGMHGVWGLSLLESLALYHHITSDKFGRGFRARDLTTQLKEKLQS
jgi:hypothetical protein